MTSIGMKRPVTKLACRELLLSGQWIPMAKTFTQTCCRCGLKHTWRLRARKNGTVEMMLV